MEDQCNINLCILAHVAFLKSNNIQITEQVKGMIKKRFMGIKNGSLSSISSGKNPIEAFSLIFTDYQNTNNIPKKKRTAFKKSTTTTTTTTDVSVSDEASVVVEGLNPPRPAMPERLRGCEITNEENHIDDKHYNYMIARKKRKREITKRRAASRVARRSREGERGLEDVPSSSSSRHHDEIENDENHDNDNENDTSVAEKKKKREKFSNGPEPPPEMPEWLRRLIADVYGGSGEIVLVIQKALQKSDLKKDQNRLSMPKNQLRHKVAEFLNDEEMNDVYRRDEKRKIVGVQSTVIGKGSEAIMDFKRWDLSISTNYILTRKWYDFASTNKLMIGQVVQVWFFRDGHGNPCFAIVDLKAENNQNPDPTTIASTSTSTANK